MCQAGALHSGRMTGTSGAQGAHHAGVLAMLAEPELRAEVERVAAAAGVRLVHAGEAAPVSRKTWTAAAAVVLDARAARNGRAA